VKKVYLLTLFVLLLSISACSATSGTPAENVFYRDDFSNETTGWSRARTDEGITDYENGVYRILVNLDNQDFLGTPGLALQSDVRVEVDANKVAGPDDNDFGVMCRYQDNNNFYQFFVSSDGYVGILKMVDGDSQNISGGQLIDHPAVNMGNALNHIRADCLGDTLTMYVNGQQVLTAQDTTFTTGGDVGVYAGTYDEPGTDVHFDNFVVKKP
jgi:hypothetical protein